MKKVLITAAIIILAIITGIFFINSLALKSNPDTQKVHVGILLNGQANDNSWSQSHYQGILKTAEALDVEVLCEESVNQELCFIKIEELIKRDCEIIICNSFDFGEGIQKAAEKYPEVCFFHATGIRNERNLSTYFGRMYQMRYLCGVVAGLQTETNEIGYVAAFPYSEVIRGINAFTLGVRAVNPDANVYVSWCNSWNDDYSAETAAEKLINGHDIDVLTMHTDSLKPLDVADKNGVFSIGYNIDNSANYPDTYLTAAVWSWDNFYTPHILECIQGRFNGGNYWDGIETGIISLAPLTENVKDGVQEVLDKELERLKSGTYDVFYGPIKDTEGIIRIAEGESMTDHCMLNDFNWFVEGVVVDE